MNRFSQNDPLWKNTQLGNSDLTIGEYGCMLTSFANASQFTGETIDPAELNHDMKLIGGFDGALLFRYSVGKVLDGLSIAWEKECRNIAAPIDVIDWYVANNSVVMVEVDRLTDKDLQPHWMLLTRKVGNDYEVLDPWPVEDLPLPTLMGRYGLGRKIEQVITFVIVLECKLTGSSTTGDNASTGTNTQSTQETPESEVSTSGKSTLRVISDYVYLRRDPSTKKDVIGKALKGDELMPTGEVQGNWHKALMPVWVNDGDGKYLEVT